MKIKKQIAARKLRREKLSEYTFGKTERLLGGITIVYFLIIAIIIYFWPFEFNEKTLKSSTITVLTQPTLTVISGKGSDTKYFEFYSKEFPCKFIIQNHAYKALVKDAFKRDIRVGDTVGISLSFNNESLPLGNSEAMVEVFGLSKANTSYIPINELNRILRQEFTFMSIIFAIYGLALYPISRLITQKQWSKYNLIGITVMLLLLSFLYFYYLITRY